MTRRRPRCGNLYVIGTSRVGRYDGRAQGELARRTRIHTKQGKRRLPVTAVSHQSTEVLLHSARLGALGREGGCRSKNGDTVAFLLLSLVAKILPETLERGNLKPTELGRHGVALLSPGLDLCLIELKPNLAELRAHALTHRSRMPSMNDNIPIVKIETDLSSCVKAPGEFQDTLTRAPKKANKKAPSGQP